MPGLAELQRDFAQAVRGGATSLAEFGVRPGGLAPERRIAVYRNHHRISLAAALAANFPSSCKVVGEAAFLALAADFVATVPPADPCLSGYGEGFADFLSGDGRLRTMPYLADVAQLDWALSLAARAPDAPTFGPENLAALAGTDLAAAEFAPHPSLTLLASPYPLLQIRDLALSPDRPEGVSLKAGGAEAMVWRREAMVQCVGLDHPTYCFIKALTEGRSLGEAASQIVPDALAQALAQFVVTGAFAAPGSR